MFTMRDDFLAWFPVQSPYSESVFNFIFTRLSASQFYQWIVYSSFIAETTSSVHVDYQIVAKFKEESPFSP